MSSFSNQGNTAHVQNIPYSEINNVRRRELASLRRPQDYKDVAWSGSTSKDSRDDNDYMPQRRVTREQYVNDDHRRSRTRSQGRHHGHRKDHSRRSRSLGNGPLGIRGAERHADQFLERNFDASFGGIIAAAAGAGIGAMGASRIGHANPYDPNEKTHRIRTFGGAVVGAAAFNALENRWRKYVGEKE